jgi:Cof subfamily protein (haloacid dehalogenase superfamily)
VAGIRLLLADVDGTLVTQEKVLTPATIAAVAALGRAGVGFAVTSGRPPRGMAMLIEPLGITTPLAGFNGGVLVHPDLSVIQQRSLPAEAARAALATILAQGLDAWLYTGTDWLVPDGDGPHVAREAWTVKFSPKVVPEFRAEDLAQAVKIVGVSDDLDRVARCESAVQEALGDQVSAARSQPYYLDVTHPQANKGEVVRTLSRLLDIPVEAIAVIGDMPNDVLMFRQAGTSIAMGNASEEVKAQASAVTASNAADGFAQAVHTVVLGQALAGDAAGSRDR